MKLVITVPKRKTESTYQRSREQFSKCLRVRLAMSDHTQADMARYMGVSTATASEWCNGKKIPRMDKLLRLTKYLGCSVDDLLPKQEKKTDSVPAKVHDAETKQADSETETPVLKNHGNTIKPTDAISGTINTMEEDQIIALYNSLPANGKAEMKDYLDYLTWKYVK